MSDIRAEAPVEPDPSATSIGNDQTVAEAPKPESTVDVPSAPTTSEDATKAEEKTAEGETLRDSARGGRGHLTDIPTTDKSTDAEKTDANANANASNTEHPNKKRKMNANKSDYSVLPESSDADEIRRQVEFYFSDSNLPTDRFLLELTGGHKNNPVDLKVIHNFKRMQRFQPYSAVLEAVKQSSTLNVDDKGEITRKEPLDEKFSDNVDENRNIHQDKTLARSIYAKGFGSEHATSQTEIEEFFAVYGNVNAVRLRRQADGFFKGSVFVEFKSEQEAQDFLKLDPAPKYKNSAENEEKTLQIKSKKEYVEGKTEDIREGRVAPKSPRSQAKFGRNDRGDRNGGNNRDRDNGGKWSRGGGARGRGNRGNSRGRGGARGGRDRRDRDGGDRRGGNDRNAERAAAAGAENGDKNDKKRSAEGGEQQGDAKKAKSDE